MKRGLLKWDWHWMDTWPQWFDVMFFRRPARRRQKALLHKVVKGKDPDGHWPDGKRPHPYFW